MPQAAIESRSSRDSLEARPLGPLDADARLRRKPISGGSVLWREDLSELRRLNAELEQLTEELEEENELIRQEKELQAERLSFEIKNRIYDRIAAEVRPQVCAIEAALSGDPEEGEAFRARLIYAAVLGAYVKRIGNLTLLAGEQERISLRELCLCIEESQRYLPCSGCTCALMVGEDAPLSPKLAMLAYRLFEAVLEAAWPKLCACSAALTAEDGFCVTLAVDVPDLSLPEDWQGERLAAQGPLLEQWQEDDTAYIRLSVGKEAAL